MCVIEILNLSGLVPVTFSSIVQLAVCKIRYRLLLSVRKRLNELSTFKLKFVLIQYVG